MGTPSIPYVGTVAGKLLPPIIPKAVNLPGAKKIIVDMAHIAKRHMEGGLETAGGRDLFPQYMSKQAVERTIREAYSFGKSVGTRGGRELIRGTSGDLIIEMYFNRQTKTIETAELVNA